MKAKIFYLNRSTATVGNVVDYAVHGDQIEFSTHSVKDLVDVESVVTVPMPGVLYIEITDHGKFVELVPGIATSFKVVPVGPEFEKTMRIQQEAERVAASRAVKKEQNDNRMRVRYAARNKANFEGTGRGF